jgi:hypothetical protein
VQGYGLDDRGFESRQELGNLLLTTVSRPALGTNQPPIQWIPGVPNLVVKRQGIEATHSPPSNAELKNAWSYTSTPHYAFMSWCSVKKKAQGQLYIYLYGMTGKIRMKFASPNNAPNWKE